MTARIVELYGVASLQGLPVYGYRRYGMPPGGAFDLASHRAANRMVGNADEALTLELGMAAAALEFDDDAIFALGGAPCLVSTNDRHASVSEAIEVSAHSVVRLRPPEEGARSYLAVRGGWASSTGLLRRGAELECGAIVQPARLLDVGVTGWTLAPQTGSKVRFIPSSALQRQECELVVGHRSDRRGVRLEGGPPGSPASEISRPCTVGTIQQTPDGTLIIIGPDGPTIGGYAQMGTILCADLDLVGQLRPGQGVRLVPAALSSSSCPN